MRADRVGPPRQIIAVVLGATVANGAVVATVKRAEAPRTRSRAADIDTAAERDRCAAALRSAAIRRGVEPRARVELEVEPPEVVRKAGFGAAAAQTIAGPAEVQRVAPTSDPRPRVRVLKAVAVACDPRVDRKARQEPIDRHAAGAHPVLSQHVPVPQNGTREADGERPTAHGNRAAARGGAIAGVVAKLLVQPYRVQFERRAVPPAELDRAVATTVGHSHGGAESMAIQTDRHAAGRIQHRPFLSRAREAGSVGGDALIDPPRAAAQISANGRVDIAADRGPDARTGQVDLVDKEPAAARPCLRNDVDPYRADFARNIRIEAGNTRAVQPQPPVAHHDLAPPTDQLARRDRGVGRVTVTAKAPQRDAHAIARRERRGGVESEVETEPLVVAQRPGREIDEQRHPGRGCRPSHLGDAVGGTVQDAGRVGKSIDQRGAAQHRRRRAVDARIASDRPASRGNDHRQ